METPTSSGKRGEEKYAEDMCSFLGLPEKKCKPAAKEWYRHERQAFENGSTN